MKQTLSFLLLATALFFVSCKQNRTRDNGSAVNSVKSSQPDKYIDAIISMDTMLAEGRKTFIKTQIEKLQSEEGNISYLYFFRAREYELLRNMDSARLGYAAMQPDENDKEIEQLRKLKLLELDISAIHIVESGFMDKLLTAVDSAEKIKSKLTYQFYDLLAKAYYQNRNEEKSMYYAELYYNNHPFKDHPNIQQRYYDISFLLASRMNDLKKMVEFNNKARELAEQINDSVAIGRSYDNEAQVYARQGLYEKSLASSKLYFNFCREKNMLNEIVYNNLGKSFLNYGQIDSAIFYYKKGIGLMEQKPLNKKTQTCYIGLRDAYARMGDYRNALWAGDSANVIQLRNIQSMEDARIAEIHEKYQAEKKDRDIADLKQNNLLNKKIINQQRWLFAGLLLIGLGVLSFLYILQRQRLLKSKNELLKAENSRLNAEQKMLQSQLNPHFVFNAIANLQSLIGSGEKALSMRYLSAFSQLLRNVLEQSRKDFISLAEEIETLKNYLNLQQMRFPNTFDLNFSIDERIDPETVLIPPMFLQPFLENAIEHGFRNIDYKGELNTTLSLHENQLEIEIDDNGSGLPKDENRQKNKKSLSGIIMQERLKTLFGNRKERAGFEVIDKNGEGDRGVLVKISMPIIKDWHQ